jgi:undecaprenyl-diphosphatase
MGIIEAIILGIIQGLTEFLPVSSSGHIELGKEVLGVEVSDPLLLSVVLHAATALSTIVIFRKDIVDIIKGLFKFKWNDETKFVFLIVVSMVPAAFVGLFFEDQIEAFFNGNILLVGFMLLLTGGLLLLADSAKNTTKNVGFMAAVLVGISQAIAILPGISRSGATISTSVLLGIDRSKAARFSFLMVVPLILGAALLDVKKFKEISELEAMAIEERVDFIMSDLQKDELVSDTEFNSVRMAIYSKEESWDFFKLKGDYAIGRQSEINKSFIVDLDTRVKSSTKDNVSGHHLAKARPLALMGFGVLLAGFLAAFFTGLLACTWMIKLVKKSQLKYFAFYCFLVGAAAISYSLFYV